MMIYRIITFLASEIPLPGPPPEGLFYYALSGLLGTAVITMLWRYSKKQEEATDRIIEMLNRHETMIQLHDQDIKRMVGKIDMSDNVADEVRRGFADTFQKIETLRAIVDNTDYTPKVKYKK